MKKTVCFLLSFAVCCLFKTQHIWIVFAPVFAIMLSFKTGSFSIWEIPLACLACSVLEAGFDDITMLLRILIPATSIIISLAYPKRLFVFFIAAVFSLYLKNIYGVAAVWAMLWSTVHSYTTRPHSITKAAALQEYKS